MYYDKLKFKREQRLPEKDFYDYTLEILPIFNPIVEINTKNSYPVSTQIIVGECRKTHKMKIQSILIPRTIEEIKNKIKNKK